MTAADWDASDLLGALRQATATLRAEIDEVNALNVFPVPDGDTGSNMLATMQAAVQQASDVPGAERDLPTVAQALSHGALVGARGNSGVILSQWLRGIADTLSGHAAVDGPTLGAALDRGCLTAVASVAHPVEGTMLTVARDAAEAAQAAATAGNGRSLEPVLAAAVDGARESVVRTPTLLPVLAEAGVVDAGGRGIELLLRGALGYVRGEGIPVAQHELVAFPSFMVEEDVGYGYETVFLVVPPEDGALDPDAIRSRLDEMGESVLVAGDERAVKIHIHNERPDEVIAYGLTLGALSEITLENLDRQTREIRWGGRRAASTEPIVRTVEAAAGPRVVVVAAGPGLAQIFANLGAAGVVTGGQGANPSTGDLLEAIRAAGGTEVIVLPKNSNVRMAAQQAATLLPDVRVEVVPTRNAAEGVAAMLTVNAADDLATNLERMTEAGAAMTSMQVTAAVRDAKIGEHDVRKGQHLVLSADERLLAAGEDRDAAVLAAIAGLEPGFELITLYYGEGVAEEDAQELAQRLGDALDGVDCEVVDGGQPHYSFLISVE